MLNTTADIARFDPETERIVFDRKEIRMTRMNERGALIQWFRSAGLMFGAWGYDTIKSVAPVWWEVADDVVPSLQIMALARLRLETMHGRFGPKTKRRKRAGKITTKLSPVHEDYYWLVNKNQRFMGMLGGYEFSQETQENLADFLEIEFVQNGRYYDGPKRTVIVSNTFWMDVERFRDAALEFANAQNNDLWRLRVWIYLWRTRGIVMEGKLGVKKRIKSSSGALGMSAPRLVIE